MVKIFIGTVENITRIKNITSAFSYRDNTRL